MNGPGQQQPTMLEIAKTVSAEETKRFMGIPFRKTRPPTVAARAIQRPI